MVGVTVGSAAEDEEAEDADRRLEDDRVGEASTSLLAEDLVDERLGETSSLREEDRVARGSISIDDDLGDFGSCFVILEGGSRMCFPGSSTSPDNSSPGWSKTATRFSRFGRPRGFFLTSFTGDVGSFWTMASRSTLIGRGASSDSTEATTESLVEVNGPLGMFSGRVFFFLAETALLGVVHPPSTGYFIRRRFIDEGEADRRRIGDAEESRRLRSRATALLSLELRRKVPEEETPLVTMSRSRPTRAL